MNVNAAKVIAGYDHMLLLSDKGELWAWGAGANGETGQNTTVRRMVPHPVLFASLTTESTESTKETEASEGTATPRTGDEASPDNETPRRSRAVSPSPSSSTPGPFIDIATGKNFSVAITQSGELYSWGNARNGVLGNGQTEGITWVATKVETNVAFTKIFAARDHVIGFGSGEGAPVVQPPVHVTEESTAEEAPKE